MVSCVTLVLFVLVLTISGISHHDHESLTTSTDTLWKQLALAQSNISLVWEEFNKEHDAIIRDIHELNATVTNEYDARVHDVNELKLDVTNERDARVRDINSLSSTVSGHTSNISNLSSTVSTLKQDVMTDITNLQRDIKEVRVNNSGHAFSIIRLEEDIYSIRRNTTQINNKLSGR